MKPNFGKGLLPAVIQDEKTGDVLMVGFMNEEAYEETLSSGEVVFWSRSKSRLWKKGETSGNVLKVKKTFLDCDLDSILILAAPTGPTCHKGERSCFGSTGVFEKGILVELEKVIKERQLEGDLASSYTAKLLSTGSKAAAQKVGEEAVEFIIASLNGDKYEICEEGADLIFHFLVLLSANGLGFSDIEAVLQMRRNN